MMFIASLFVQQRQVRHVRAVKLERGREQMILLLRSSYLIGFSLRLLRKHKSLKFKAVLQSESCQGPLSH